MSPSPLAAWVSRDAPRRAAASPPYEEAIIIGAGPAGLTAAHELLTRTDVQPIILEKSDEMGGLSRTVEYKGNRIDIGGHRFFSKSDRVMKWWLSMMPIQNGAAGTTFSITGCARRLGRTALRPTPKRQTA